MHRTGTSSKQKTKNVHQPGLHEPTEPQHSALKADHTSTELEQQILILKIELYKVICC